MPIPAVTILIGPESRDPFDMNPESPYRKSERGAGEVVRCKGCHGWMCEVDEHRDIVHVRSGVRFRGHWYSNSRRWRIRCRCGKAWSWRPLPTAAALDWPHQREVHPSPPKVM